MASEQKEPPVARVSLATQSTATEMLQLIAALPESAEKDALLKHKQIGVWKYHAEVCLLKEYTHRPTAEDKLQGETVDKNGNTIRLLKRGKWCWDCGCSAQEFKRHRKTMKCQRNQRRTAEGGTKFAPPISEGGAVGKFVPFVEDLPEEKSDEEERVEESEEEESDEESEGRVLCELESDEESEEEKSDEEGSDEEGSDEEGSDEEGSVDEESDEEGSVEEESDEEEEGSVDEESTQEYEVMDFEAESEKAEKAEKPKVKKSVEGQRPPPPPPPKD